MKLIFTVLFLYFIFIFYRMMIESQSFNNDDFKDITRFIDYYMDSKDEIYINAKIGINPNKKIEVENHSIKIILKDSNKVEYFIKNANIKQLHNNKLLHKINQTFLINYLLINQFFHSVQQGGSQTPPRIWTL
jgi:hypothetical protein